jgi:dihydropteroate synthase
MNTSLLTWPSGQLDFSRGCLIMGILNVTPDSFSDGGLFLDRDKAVAQGLAMVEQGAAVIDVGAESSRPGSAAVSAEEQIRRAIPVIERLVQRTEVPISIDTGNASVARAALEAGATLVNDITALSDESMPALVAQAEAPVVLMHMQGVPSTMQKAPSYDDVVEEVLGYLLDRAREAEDHGIRPERIILDPGIGFGKTFQHNIALLQHIDKFVLSGYRCLVGTSRKSLIGQLTGKPRPADRLLGTAATVAHCAARGVSLVRVHDVDEMVDVIKVIQAIS